MNYVPLFAQQETWTVVSNKPDDTDLLRKMYVYKLFFSLYALRIEKARGPYAWQLRKLYRSAF
jgi:hypothetical protein